MVIWLLQICTKDCIEVLVLVFWGTLILISIIAEPIYTAMNNMDRILYPMLLTTIHYLAFLMTTILDREGTVIYINNAYVLGFKNIYFYMYASECMHSQHVQCRCLWRLESLQIPHNWNSRWLRASMRFLKTEPATPVIKATALRHWTISLPCWLTFDRYLGGRTILSGVGIGRETYKKSSLSSRRYSFGTACFMSTVDSHYSREYEWSEVAWRSYPCILLAKYWMMAICNWSHEV